MAKRAAVENEFYETHPGYTLALCDVLGTALDGCNLFEPAAGLGMMTRALEAYPRPGRAAVRVLGNDPYRGEWETKLDMNHPAPWSRFAGFPDWTITNPPFSLALPMLKYALGYSQRGVAMLLRISFLEPVGPFDKEREMVAGLPQTRGEWLSEHPPSALIVFPRRKFNPHSKGTDSATVAWVIWWKRVAQSQSPPFPTFTFLTRQMFSVLSERALALGLL